MAGRKKDAVWVNFEEKKSASGKFNKAVCKCCKKELMGIVARMKKHLETCVREIDRNRNIDAGDDDGGNAASAGNLLSYLISDQFPKGRRYVTLYLSP